MNGLLTSRRSPKCQVACVMSVFAIAISGCGSSSHSGTKGSGGASGADTAAAKAQVEKYSAPMTSVNLPALKQKPAPGKKIVVVTNSTSGSVTVNDSAVAAAKALGWTAIRIVYDASSPTGLTGAFAQAVTDKPDGIITNSLDQTSYAQAAKTLAKNGTPVVTSSTTDQIASPVIANVAPAAQPELAGRLTADYVIAQKGDKASVAVFNIPSFPILGVWEKGFKDEYTKLCPKCHFESHAVQVGDIGTNLPGQVVSALQRTPSINFAAMGFGAMSTGVSGALASAGLNSVKIVGEAASNENFADISKGTEEMWVALPLKTIGWKSVDALARHFNGEDVAISTTSEAPLQIVTKANVSDPPAIPEVVDFEAIFKKLWLIG